MAKSNTARHAPNRPAASGGASAGRGAAKAAAELDRIIHERVRLGIVSALAGGGGGGGGRLSFNELKALLKVSDGNLSVHARKLEEAKYVSCRKGFDGRVPRT